MNIYVGFLLTVLNVKFAESQLAMTMETFVPTKKCPGDGGILETMEQQKRLAEGSLGSLSFKLDKRYDVLVNCSRSHRENPKSIWITTDRGRFSNNMCRMMSAGGGRYYLQVTVTETNGGKLVYQDELRCGYPESTPRSSGRSAASVTLPTLRPAAVSTTANVPTATRHLPQATEKPLPNGEPPRTRGQPQISQANLPHQTYVTSRHDPIMHLSGNCPPTSSGSPGLHLTADVPAFAKAICKNGPKVLSTTNDVFFDLAATFSQSNPGGNCQFYKKVGSNTFTVDVEIGWGEEDAEVVLSTLIKTVTCAYDDHGNALTSDQTISDWFLAPKEIQTLRGANSQITFSMKVFDVLNKELKTDHISIGRKIRLMATNSSGPVAGFRALSCNAENNFKSYAILRAGCGDGHIFPKTKGFSTRGNVVYSPFFDAFQLRGGDGLRFECHFTVCTSKCDGSSCPSERRKRRSPYRQRIALSQRRYLYRKRYQQTGFMD